jgi:hypothetical protein
MSICKCGEIEQLITISEKQNDFELNFQISKINKKYFIDFSSNEIYEIISCWSCGGLEVGDISSESYLMREFCKCKKMHNLIQFEKYPISFDEVRSFFTISYLFEKDFSSIVLFCPFCAGKLFDRNML